MPISIAILLLPFTECPAGTYQPSTGQSACIGMLWRARSGLPCMTLLDVCVPLVCVPRTHQIVPRVPLPPVLVPPPAPVRAQPSSITPAHSGDLAIDCRRRIAVCDGMRHLDCAAGTYAPQRSSVCADCPAGTWSAAKAGSCTRTFTHTRPRRRLRRRTLS